MYKLTETERIALVAEHTYNPVVIADAERKIVWVNQAFTDLTGYTLDEVAGKTPSSFLHFEKTDKTVAHDISEKLARHEKVCADMLNKNKWGREYWIRFCITPVTLNDRFAGYISIENEITKEVSLLQDLRESELKYKAIFKSSNDRHVFIDKDGILLAYNHSAKKYIKQNLGIEIIEGESLISQLNTDQTREIFLAGFDAALLGEETHIERNIVLPAGGSLWYSIHTVPVYNEEGEIMGCTVNWAETTKEKLLEEDLKQSALKYKAIIDSTEDRHVLVDKDGKVLAYNKSAKNIVRDLFGVELEEGIVFVELFKDNMQYERLKDGIAAALNHQTVTYESPASTSNTDKWLRLRYFPVYDSANELVGASVNWSDITAQKTAELKAQNQLNQLREFSYITSHKLRQPLANIIGLIDLISTENPDDIKSYLSKLRIMSSELDDVINAMSQTVATVTDDNGITAKQANTHKIPQKAFIVDDDPVNNLITRKFLEKSIKNVEVEEFIEAEKALQKLKDGASPDLILLDINMHPIDGWAFLDAFEKLQRGIPIIMCSSSVDPADLLRAKTHPLVRTFLSKPLSGEQIKTLYTINV